MAVIISIANQKGGVGKTTTTLTLAHCLAKYEHKKVLVIDADPQHNASLILGRLPPFDYPVTFSEIVRDGVDIKNGIFESKYPGIDLLPSNLNLFGWEGSASDQKAFQGLQQSLAPEVKAEYDFVLIDCPPNLSASLNNSLIASDYYIIPIKAEDWFALKGIHQLYQHVEFIKKFNPKLQLLGAVVTMFDARTKIGRAMDISIRNFFKDLMFKNSIRGNTALSRATAKQQTIIDHDKKAGSLDDYKALTKEIIERLKG